jgi:hypothetical protein
MQSRTPNVRNEAYGAGVSDSDFPVILDEECHRRLFA